MRNRILNFIYDVAGDLGLYNRESVLPIQNQEPLDEGNLGRDSANLRNRTDVLRDDNECLRRLVMGNIGLSLIPSPAEATVSLNTTTDSIDFTGSLLTVFCPRTATAVGLDSSAGEVSVESATPDEPFSIHSLRREYEGGNRIEVLFTEDPTLDPTDTVLLDVEGGACIRVGFADPSLGNLIRVTYGSTATVGDFATAVNTSSSPISDLISVSAGPFAANGLVDGTRVHIANATDKRSISILEPTLTSFFEENDLLEGEVFGISFDSQLAMEYIAADGGGAIPVENLYISNETYRLNRAAQFNIPLFWRRNNDLYNLINGLHIPEGTEGTLNVDSSLRADLLSESPPDGTTHVGHEAFSIANGEEVTDDYGSTQLDVAAGSLKATLTDILQLIKGRLGLEGGTISGSLTVNTLGTTTSGDFTSEGGFGVKGTGASRGVFGESAVHGVVGQGWEGGVVGQGVGTSSAAGGTFTGGNSNGAGVIATGKGAGVGVLAIGAAGEGLVAASATGDSAIRAVGGEHNDQALLALNTHVLNTEAKLGTFTGYGADCIGVVVAVRGVGMNHLAPGGEFIGGPASPLGHGTGGAGIKATGGACNMGYSGGPGAILEGGIGAGLSPAPAAPLRLVPGAPSTPENGDIWFHDGTLQFRINDTTYTVATV